MKRLTLLLICIVVASIQIAWGQTREISGTVTSAADGLPLPGVTVLLKGTNLGVITDSNGKYAIKIPADAQILSFSFVGMEKMEVTIGNQSAINVQMKSGEIAVDEVVVVAYGSARRESVSGSISQINTKAIEKRPVSSVSAVLEGQAAGVQVNNTYGEPGADPVVRIRGFSTINGSNAPLYVIDGVPFGGNISDMNPSDIESVSILKDAASSALFGNRASNGVIMITTKKGKSEKGSLKFSMNQGFFTRGLKEYERLGANDFMEVMWLGYRNSLMTSQPTTYPTIELANAEAGRTLIPTYLKYNIYNTADNALFDTNGKLVAGAKIREGYDDLDWYKYVERPGHRQDFMVSGEGASEKYNYFFSVGYLDEKGYVLSSDFKRLTGRTNISLTPRNWIKAGISLSGSHQISNSTQGSPIDDNLAFINPFYYARNMAPIYPVYLHDLATGDYILDANGNKQYDSGGTYSRPQNSGRHVIWEYELNSDIFTRNTLNSQVFTDIQLPKGFTLSLKGDISIRSSDEHDYRNILIGDGAGTGRAFGTMYRYKNYTLQQILSWKKEFNKHEIDMMGAHENFLYNYSYTDGGKSTEIFRGGREFINFTVITYLDGYQRDYRTESYLSRLRYNFDKKYYFDASYRSDGSSKFHPDNRWGNFWSSGGSWIVSKEPFMASIKNQVNNLKLRASYGEVGNDGGMDNDAINFHSYMALYANDQNGNKGAVYKTQNEAPNLKWESSSAFGIGIEGRFFKRINLSAEYFDKRSKNLIFDVNLPLSAGPTSIAVAESTIKKNLGSISNRGVEVATDFDILNKNEFRWNLGLMATWMKNKIISLPEQNRQNGIIKGTKKYMEGHDIYQFWLFQFAGVDQMTGNSLYLADLDKYYVGTTPEEGKTAIPTQWLVTINDKPYTRNTTYAKRDWSGSAIPDLFGSLSTSMSYKNFDLSALCTYSLGGKMLDYSYQDLMGVIATPSSLHKDLLRSWNGVPAGMTETSPTRIDPRGIPAINYSLSTYNNDLSSRFLQDASYLVIKNISLAYRMPGNILKILDISDCTVNVSVENLASFTKLQGMNPQQSFNGINDNGFVTARVLSVGFNFKL